MKIIINSCVGGFSINNILCQQYGFKKYGESRTNKKLIELIESGIYCSGECADLRIVEIPDEATDYYIDNYDGLERVLYVIDGKINFS